MKPDISIIPEREPIDTTRRSLSPKDKLEVMIRHGRCVICGGKLTTLAETEFHHSGTAKWAGGSDELDNFGPAHKACNRELGKQEAADALRADKMGGRKGQQARRAKAKAEGRHRAIPGKPLQSANRWPPKGSQKIRSRPFPERRT